MATVACQLSPQLSCHSWSADRSHLAICPDSNEIHIYRESATGQWSRIHAITEHDQLVSGLDWSTQSNQLVSCSHDRNSYVFTWKDQLLEPEMVITRLSKAATCVRWSPSEQKFAIGSAAKAVCICYYEQESHWWASKLIRRQHDSSILAVSWHPNSILLATASSDSKCRVFSTALPGIDSEQVLSGMTSRFGDCLLQIDSLSSWCHAVAWSPSGSQLAFASQGSTLQFMTGIDALALMCSRPVSQDIVTVASSPVQHNLQQELKHDNLQLRQLPFKVVAFLAEDLLIAGGFDGEMYLFQSQNHHWQLRQTIQGDLQRSHAANMRKQLSADFSKKLDMFKQQSASPASNKVMRRSTQPEISNSPHKPAHTSCIIDLHVFCNKQLKPAFQFSTAGSDGQVVQWDVCDCLGALPSASRHHH